ncbi:MAG: exonuclease SbcCD subunit D [Poseidonibacter sp.]|uniref:metallophosphoesterase family protein n=1 Tax=Poseidonibacter sp. TaxID=2321188 RepID=UPI00359D609A
MKIIHFSDTHLGYNDLDILDENNINQREADFYDAFSQIVEQIKTIKPDYIIHTGDLFHRSSPSNRAITYALQKFKEIDELNIPFILIAGNHSTPRTNLSSPILKIFENFKNIYVSYSQEYKKVEFDDVVFHTLPHMNDDSKANEQIELCESNIDKLKKNIMMMHCSVGAWYLMQEFGEWVYPTNKEYIFQSMDYVALGHWHGFGAVSVKGTKEKYPNVYYSGSSERTSLNDKRNSKGFIELDIKETLSVQYKEIDIRAIRQKQIDCEDFETSIKDIDISDTNNAIVDVKLVNLTALQSIDIQNSQIKELFPNAMSVNIKREFKKNANETNIDDVEALSLEDFFIEHIKEDSDNKEFDRLKTKVQELFSLYEESSNDTM